MSKVQAKNLPSAGRLFQHWIEQAVFIRWVGHQAIPNGFDILDTRDYTRTMRKDHPGIYGRLEDVPNGELAIRWFNH